MKIWYTTILPHEPQHERTRYKVDRREACCETMRVQYVNEMAVEFDPEDGYGTDCPHSLHIIEHITAYHDIDKDWVTINFCPWCGAPIECIEARRVQAVRKSIERTLTRTESVTTYIDPTTGDEVTP